MRSMAILIAGLLCFGLLTAPAGVLAQDTPDQIQAALNDLNSRLGTTLTLNDLASYSYEIRQFEDASLGCPQPGEAYAQVMTPGYQFVLGYAGEQYDYRVSQDGTTLMLCTNAPAVEATPAAPETAPASPVRRQMDQPIVAISPLTGMPGDSVQVIANGFPRSVQVMIGIGPVESEYDVVRTTRTTNQGTLFTTVTIPTYFTMGGPVVLVVETADNQLRVVSYPFTIRGDNGSGSVPGNPLVTLSPLSGAPGSAVQLTATGFPANASVLIGVGPQNSADFVYSLQEVTDAQGNLNIEIAIPEDAQVNRPYVALVELQSDRTYEAISPVFIPTGDAPTPAPEGAEFSQADIYLIAAGDNGQSGIPVGCNDSAIPVQVSFAPTVAPLTSALQQLFTLNAQTYGQSGLYNALYRSALTLESIDIQNGMATINLSGTLQVGGACDVPRVEAQITQTALQFDTIDSVSVLVNGQPIADVLGG